MTATGELGVCFRGNIKAVIVMISGVVELQHVKL
jgi:hypothetical protein